MGHFFKSKLLVITRSGKLHIFIHGSFLSKPQSFLVLEILVVQWFIDQKWGIFWELSSSKTWFSGPLKSTTLAAEIHHKNFSHLRCSAASGEPAAFRQTSPEPAGDGTVGCFNNYGLWLTMDYRLTMVHKYGTMVYGLELWSLDWFQGKF